MQLKFLLNNLGESDQLQRELVALGIADNDIHFLSERHTDFAGHNIHEASIFEERDLIHSSIQGGFLGVLVGMVVVMGIHIFEFWGWQLEAINVIFLLALFTGFGGWLGGLFGISHRNYRLSEFESELQQGKALMLVYTEGQKGQQARSLMQRRHPKATFLGEDSNYDNPFKHSRLAELED